MTDVSLNPITSGYNTSKLNSNFTAIQDSINGDLINRTGGNNIMDQDLDLNSNNLLNVAEIDASIIRLDGGVLNTSPFVISAAYDATLTKKADLASTAAGKGAALIGAFNSTLAALLPGLTDTAFLDSAVAAQTSIFRNRTLGFGTRVHIEPNGLLQSGTCAKLDLMHDPLDGPGGNAANYRILNFYTHKDKTQPQGAASIINTKAVGSGYFGFVPPMHFAINDDGYVPMSVYFFSGKTDNQWYLNYVGMHVAGVVVAVGDRMSENNKLYEATTAGTTGATSLTHTSGTASDGAVTWQFLRDYTVDAGAGYFHPLVMIGNKTDWPKFGHWDARMQVARPMVFWNGTGKLRFLKSDSTAAWELFQTTGGNTLEFNNGAGKKMTLDCVTGDINLTGMTLKGPTATVIDPGAAWNVTGLEKVVLALSSGTLTISTMTGGTAFQEIKIIAGSGGITLQHATGPAGGVIHLKAGVDKVLAQYEGITLMANSTGGFFTEI